MIARFILIALIFSLSACGVSLKKLDNVFAGEGERAKLLGKTVESYHQAMYWNDGELASSYVSPEVRSSFIRDFSQRKNSEKLVDVKIESIDYQPEKLVATVNTKTKFYQIPAYTVLTRFEQEKWKFDRFSGGWHTEGVTEVDPSHFAKSNKLPAEEKSFRGRLTGAGGRTFQLD